MKPVMQKSLGLGHGDCLHACLASILECDLADIPNLSAETKTLADQIANEDAFLASRGMRAIRCLLTGSYESGDVFFLFDGYGIAWGKSPRSHMQHCVVVVSDDGMLRIAHDPHPGGLGIEGEFTGVSWIVCKTVNDRDKGTPADTVPRAVADRLESRVATLEAALREIDRNGPPTESLSDFADKYTSDNMGDVFDAGVSCGAASAGAIAREALEAKP